MIFCLWLQIITFFRVKPSRCTAAHKLWMLKRVNCWTPQVNCWTPKHHFTNDKLFMLVKCSCALWSANFLQRSYIAGVYEEIENTIYRPRWHKQISSNSYWWPIIKYFLPHNGPPQIIRIRFRHFWKWNVQQTVLCLPVYLAVSLHL